MPCVDWTPKYFSTGSVGNFYPISSGTIYPCNTINQNQYLPGYWPKIIGFSDKITSELMGNIGSGTFESNMFITDEKFYKNSVTSSIPDDSILSFSPYIPLQITPIIHLESNEGNLTKLKTILINMLQSRPVLQLSTLGPITTLDELLDLAHREIMLEEDKK